MVDWQKPVVTEKYAQFKDPSSILIAQGMDGDLDKHCMPRAALQPKQELLDAVYDGVFEIRGKRANLRELITHLSQVCLPMCSYLSRPFVALDVRGLDIKTTG